MNTTPRDNSQKFVLVDAELASLARLCLPETRVLKRKVGPVPLWIWFLIAAVGVFVNSLSRKDPSSASSPPDVSSSPPFSTPDLSSFEALPSGGPTSDRDTNAASGDIRAALGLQSSLRRTILKSEDDVAQLVSAQIGAYNGSSTGARSFAARSTPAAVPQPGGIRAPIIVPVEAPDATSSAATKTAEAAEPAKRQPAAGRQKRRRTPLLLLAAASLALNGVFIWHAKSRVPRPSLVVVRPAIGSPASQGRLGSDAGPKTPGAVKTPRAVVRSGASDVVSGSTAPDPQRSETRASGQPLHQQHPKHQSHPGRPSGRRPTRPVLSATRASEPPVSPVHAVAVRAGQHLRWKAVAGATYYNLVLWRNGKRVLDVWPTSPQAVLPSNWTDHGIQDRLVPGRYLWFVYPGLGAKASQHYGPLAGSGVLVVQPKGGK
jgi:hypothetical protein